MKLSVLIVFQGIGLENVRNDQNVPKGMCALRLRHIHDDKIALSNNISPERTEPFGLIFRMKHLGKGECKFVFFYANRLFKMATMPIYRGVNATLR